MAYTRNGINIDISGFNKLAAKFPDIVAEETSKFIDELAQDGARIARVALNDAVTIHGIKRFNRGRGNSEGRNDSGRMRNNLRALKPRTDSNGNVRAEVGWYYPNKYFVYQESGTGRYRTPPRAYDPNWDYASAYTGKGGGIVGAHSLWTARSYMEKSAAENANKLKRNISKRIRNK